MRIAHVTEAWNGGISTYVNTLIARQAKNHEVMLVYSKSATQKDFNEDFYRRNNIRIFPYRSSRNPAKFLQISYAINSILKKHNPDIVHLHSTFAGVYGRLIRNNLPVIYCPHGWSFVQESGAFKKKLYTHVEKRLARRCDAIVNISHHEYDEALKAGVRSPLDIVIPNGVNDAEPPGTLTGFAVNSGHINIGYIGRLDYKKGFDIAANAFSRLRRHDMHLYVMGAASRNGLGDIAETGPNIHYLGWINNTDIDSYIKKFDAVIVPSRSEGFGLVVVEAMRNKCPAIVSNAGSLPELVVEGHNGYIFDINEQQDTLVPLLENLDKKTLAAMGENARRLYEEKFTSERVIRDIRMLYKRVLYTSNTSS
jgi:glycosyltransferase involved in cell wall biosynthesis